MYNSWWGYGWDTIIVRPYSVPDIIRRIPPDLDPANDPDLSLTEQQLTHSAPRDVDDQLEGDYLPGFGGSAEEFYCYYIRPADTKTVRIKLVLDESAPDYIIYDCYYRINDSDWIALSCGPITIATHGLEVPVSFVISGANVNLVEGENKIIVRTLGSNDTESRTIITLIKDSGVPSFIGDIEGEGFKKLGDTLYIRTPSGGAKITTTIEDE